MWVGTAVGADLKQRRLLTPIRNEADIKEIVLFVTGEERARVAKKMIETFFVVALKKGATLVTANADADDEELVSVLKSFGFERTSIAYKMSKKL